MKTQTIQVKVSGATPIMFDRFVSMETSIPPSEKVYLNEKKELVFPALNVMSFLSSQLTESATQRVMGKTWKTKAKAAQSFAIIAPYEIPITRNDITLTPETAELTIAKHVARVKKSGGLIIPSPKERPVLKTPWEMEFQIKLIANKDLSSADLQKIFVDGGAAVGFGTFRGVFGKFEVVKWEVSD